MEIVKLLEAGLWRVLNGQTGMTFVVDEFTDGVAGKIAHVRDYRFTGLDSEYQIWSIPAGEYEIIS